MAVGIERPTAANSTTRAVAMARADASRAVGSSPSSVKRRSATRRLSTSRTAPGTSSMEMSSVGISMPNGPPCRVFCMRRKDIWKPR